MNNRRNSPPRRRRRSLAPPGVRRERRIRFVGGFLIFCMLGLIFRVWYIQDRHGEEFAAFAAMEQSRRAANRVDATFAAERGGFLDRHMHPITETQQVFTVFLDAQALHLRHLRLSTSEEDIRDEVFYAIFSALNVPIWNLQEALRADPLTGELVMREGRYRYVLRTNVAAEIAIPLTDEFPELHREEESLRWHQDPLFAPHVIGFMRGDAIWGLESQYNDELEGEEGRNIWAQGETETVPVRHGHTIITTLDSEIQRLAQDTADRTFSQHSSNGVGIIVMDPHTSGILAMAQAPTFSLADPFNPDYFTDLQLAYEWEELTDGQRAYRASRLWSNYHITGSNEPGSVFKPFVIAAGIEEGVITRHTTFFCEGVRTIHDMPVSCHNEWGCGTISLRRALYRSCNLAMADINRALTRDVFYMYRGYFGFGERTGIDFPGEDAVSSPAVMYPRGRIGPVELATSSMGQGFNATTLQLINGYAALINGGILRRPHFVSQIIDINGNPVYTRDSQQFVRQVISQETSDFMRNEMRFVVSNTEHNPPHVYRGTGRLAHIPGHDIAGKTGTAQQGIRADRIHNLSFITFFPASDPQYLILITIDRIEDDNLFAGDTVAPIMREFISELIRMKNIAPVGNVEPAPGDLAGAAMPDFAGYRLAEAVSTAIRMNAAGYQATGGGIIVSHTWPPAGHPMPENSPIIFYLDPETRISERMTTMPDVVGLTADMAERILEDANLTPVLLVERAVVSDEENFAPRTFNVERPEEGEDFVPPPPVASPYVVFQQSPAPGMEIEQGTQVIVRAR